jgi:hypothetical protein
MLVLGPHTIVLEIGMVPLLCEAAYKLQSAARLRGLQMLAL